MVKLLTNDTQEIEIDYKYLVNMKLVNALLGVEDGTYEEMSEEELCEINEKTIPLDDVDMVTLKKILEYCENIEHNEKLEENDKEEYLKSYFKCSDTLLYKVINGSNYVQHEHLLDKACQEIADIIRACNSIDDIKKRFNITNELSAEDEKEIMSSEVLLDK